MTAGASLQIAADASDDVGVLAVELLVDGEVVGRDERPPYGVAVTVPQGADRLTVGARAFDFAANRGDAAPVEVAVARTFAQDARVRYLPVNHTRVEQLGSIAALLRF